MKGIIFVDVGKCLGCRTCEIECAVAHSQSKNLFEAINEVPSSQPRVSVSEVEGLSVPIQCRHCEAAPCVAICPTGAISKRGLEGPVTIDEKLCVGCRSCLAVCPYGIPQVKRGGKLVTKCDLCFERLELGQEPACVAGCPTGALQYRIISEIGQEIRKEVLSRFTFESGTSE